MMKTKLLLMLVAIALVVGTAQANLLLNPGFEEGAFTPHGTPDFWVHYWTTYDPVHTWVNDSDEARSGEKYMKMYNWLVYNTASSSTAYLGQDVPGMKEDGDYTFTVWAKNGAEDQVNKAAIFCDWLDSFNNWIGSDSVVIPVTGSDWIELDFGVFTTPEGTAAGTIWLAAPVGNGLNAICYDDIIMLGPDPNVDAGPDMISWYGQTVSLTGSESLPGGYTTITWSAEPAGGVVIVGGDTFEPDVTITLPSPDLTTYKLTLDIDGGGKYDVTKIDVYHDACAAWLGAGLRETTDIVGDDCITDLADLAEIAATWTDDNALTEPTAKESVVEPGMEPTLGPVAEEIAILNAGFENPVLDEGEWIEPPNWDYVGGDTAEIWTVNPGSGGTSYDAFDSIAPEGDNVGIAGVREGEGGLGQVLTETLAADLTYELIVEVGRNTLYSWNGYKIQLLAGGIVLAEDDNSLAIAPNTFETSIVTYDSGATPAQLGERLEIRLLAIGVGSYLEVNYDDVRLCAGIPFDFKPSPAGGAPVEPTSDLELSWANMPATSGDPNDPVWVDVWFGTEPNKPSDPRYTKVVSTGENVNSVTVDVSTLGTYYWQVDWYLEGDPNVVNYTSSDPNSLPLFPIVEGFILSFHAVSDVPVSVDAGPDWITWSDQAVQLEPTIYDDGASAVTIAWSVDPNRVLFNPNDGGDGTTSSAKNPTATITRWSYSAATIINAGFEDPVLADGAYSFAPGWSAVNSVYWQFALNPGLPGTNVPCFDGIAPEGENIGIAEASGDEGGLGQVLLEVLAADTTYELIVEVGLNKFYDRAGYKVQLLAGGRVLAEDDNSVTIAPDTFETSTVTYNSGATPAQLGEPLEIRLLATSDGSYVEVNFDNVRLTANPPFSPTWAQTVTLTVSVEDDVGFDEDTMTIYVYNNLCQAAIIGLGKEIDPGDFDADCDTDLKDFAAMAKEWLVYNELTGPVEKP